MVQKKSLKPEAFLISLANLIKFPTLIKESFEDIKINSQTWRYVKNIYF